MKTKIYTVALIIVLMLFILSASIALPLWCRFFYFMQIGPLDLVETTGYSREVIVDAFNELMNYLNFNRPFGTGALAYSESGKSHFEDCKVLFDLDTYVCLISGALLIVALVLAKTKTLKPCKLKGFSFWFYAGVLCVVLPVILGVLVAIDFDKAFEVFHKIFFPGKDNWLFNSSLDQIIKILPQAFFRNCGILIGASVLITSVTLIALGMSGYKKSLSHANFGDEKEASPDDNDN